MLEVPFYLFVYGTLKKGNRLHFLLRDSEYIDKIMVKGYAISLIFNDVTELLHTKKDAHGSIGELYHITSQEVLNELIQVEQGYFPEPVGEYNGHPVHGFVRDGQYRYTNSPLIKLTDKDKMIIFETDLTKYTPSKGSTLCA